MVQAILENRKSMTRLIVKPQPVAARPAENAKVGLPTYHGDWIWDRGNGCATVSCRPNGPEDIVDDCPYQIGTRLWVRETWKPKVSHSCRPDDSCDCGDVQVFYAAGGNKHFSDADIPADWTFPKAAKTGMVSPLFMPRWASRITLEVTGVRVERVQEISEEDAIAEGCPIKNPDPFVRGYGAYSASGWFSDVWESIHGPGSWERNDWTWAISFKRVEGK